MPLANMPKYRCCLDLPAELESLQMFAESECSHVNSETGSQITKITRKERGLSGNHFPFQLFFFYRLGVFITHHEFIDAFQL